MNTPGIGRRWLALVGATIYTSPNEDAIRDGVVVINANKIGAVGTKAQIEIPHNAQLLDCLGHTITAGFWNSHVHFMERKWADAATIPVWSKNSKYLKSQNRVAASIEL
jgi:dihydroorotase-like cyclic amidohydrolase